jgi:hypothetical protein
MDNVISQLKKSIGNIHLIEEEFFSSTIKIGQPDMQAEIDLMVVTTIEILSETAIIYCAY